ncbi:MAG TPA: helix-turn-helix domain-containing protein [Nocardioides sp.]|nr:helix-turn-helix domain-containing protein [Nocardioides sp.]
MHEEHAALLHALDPATLGGRVRAARVARGLTQTQLGGDGVSTGYVSRIESGERRPTLAVLTTLASRLDTTVDHLLRGISGSAYDELRLALDYAELALENGEAVDAESQARSALERARAAGQDALVLRAESLVARGLENQGRLNEAIEIWEHAIERATGPDLIAAGIALSRCYRESGDLALAIEVGERIEATITASGLDGTDDAVRLAMTIAAALYERGDLNQAARRCNRAIETAERLDSPAARSAAYWEASIVQARRGDVAAASQLAGRALALLAEGNDRRNLARLRIQVTRLMLRTDEPDPNLILRQAETARAELTTTSASAADVTMNDLTLAQAHLQAGDAGLAAEIAERALATCPPDAILAQVEGWVTLGRAHSAQGDTDTALLSYHRGVEVLEAIGASRAAAQLWFDLAGLLEDADDHTTARFAYRQAAEATGLQRQLRTTGVPVG